jgi:hypothetical protein
VTGCPCLRPDYCTRAHVETISSEAHYRIGDKVKARASRCDRDPGAWDLLPIVFRYFIRATLVVGLVLASSSETAGLPKECRAGSRWTRLIRDVACGFSLRLQRKRWSGPTTPSWLHTHEETGTLRWNQYPPSGAENKQFALPTRRYNDRVDQTHPISRATYEYWWKGLG